MCERERDAYTNVDIGVVRVDDVKWGVKLLAYLSMICCRWRGCVRVVERWQCVVRCDGNDPCDPIRTMTNFIRKSGGECFDSSPVMTDNDDGHFGNGNAVPFTLEGKKY